jgi:cation diffusion facilitator CzcD-associated flavoprotein CzcO
MPGSAQHHDVLIIGAGFGGLYMLIKARELGLSARVFEAGDGVGGTWYWNRYPGARCDIESMEYSYQFSEELQQEWEWTERYAAQPEILAYLEHVADRFGLRPGIRFNTRVTSAHFDEQAGHWRVGTGDGESHTATFVVAATGCLSVPFKPDFPGQETFRGRILHTGEWPHEGVDFSGQRVAMIGTGSSGIQSTPLIARQAGQLTLFQRTPAYSVPAHNHALDPQEAARIKAHYAEFRARNKERIAGYGGDHPFNEHSVFEVSPEERREVFARYWQEGGLLFLGAFSDLLLDPKANAEAAAFVREKIVSRIEDPELAEKLAPFGYIACKRLCADTDFFETFNRDNVRLVDVNETPIERFTERGIRTSEGEFEFDAIVLATGFDAMTGALDRIDIRGRDGLRLRDKWENGPLNYLGLEVAGFPNFFMVTGPGSPSVLSNMVPSIEQHVEWISDCIAWLRAHDRETIEADPTAEQEWVAWVNAVADMSVYPHCNSWYLGANVPGKPRVFSPCLGVPDYRRKCEEVVANGYQGFIVG